MGRCNIYINIAVFLSVIFVCGCLYRTKTPMDALVYQAKEVKNNKQLFVFLRGMGGSHKSFKKNGFVDAVRDRELPFDMVAPNTHLGYYNDRSLELRLKKDIIDPARARGYKKIWLVGISLGGMGSIFYVRKYPDDIEGVITIAPFLGSGAIVKEIEKVGGLKKWNPGMYDEKDWQRLLWHWLKVYTRQDKDLPPLYIGYGQSDINSRAHKLLAEVLPREQVVMIKGRHSNSTFKKLWEIFLDGFVKS